MNRLRITLLTLAALTLALPALAHGFKAGPIEIEHPWARATAEGAANGAAFLVLTNGGKTADRLVGTSSPAAAKVQLHAHIDDNGVMRMREVNAIDLAPDATVKLAPGGLHVMLLGLTEPLKKGKAFPLTLTFEKAGAVTVEVSVQGAGDLKPGHEHGPGQSQSQNQNDGHDDAHNHHGH
ncbi:MAG: copper chaperone PCu(A)C [Rhodospirillaceae bacterium]